MRVRYLLAILLASASAFAYTPEELLTQRDVAVKCERGVCTLSEKDLEWMVGRDRLLSIIAQKAYGQLQACRGEKAT